MTTGKNVKAFSLPRNANLSAFIRQEGSGEPPKTVAPQRVAYTVKVPVSMHMPLKLKLVREKKTFQDLALDAIMAFLGPDAEGLS